jgi:predicted nucleic acid-binding protein
MIAADTNIFLQAADPHAVSHTEAIHFMEKVSNSDSNFVICELVLV